MNYSDWGPFLVNPKPEGEGHICYQCGKPGARVQHIIGSDYTKNAEGRETGIVRDDAPTRYKCQTIRDCVKS
jgi:hypothetical protein